MSYGGLRPLNVDDMWGLIESLASYQWQYKCASESFVHRSSPPYDLHTQPPSVAQFKDGCDHHSSYPLMYVLIVNLLNSCPYYDVCDEAYATLNAIIETMNEQNEHLVGEMRVFGLLHEIGPRLTIPRLESRHDDYESSPPLEFNIVDDVPLTELQEVFDAPLTSFSVVAPSFLTPP